MDLLLINPPREIPQRADFPPIGLAYIAAYLRRAGVTVEIVDGASYSWKRLEDALRRWSPRIVGLPCWTIERGQAFKTADLVRSVHPDAKLVIGGHHATAYPDHMFRRADADAVVVGEGETTTLELVRNLIDGGDISQVRGIAYRQGEFTVLTDPRPLIHDLDSLPFPCHDSFDLDDYLGLPETSGRAASIMTSRGCPHKCIYCSGSIFWHRKWRARSPENVLDEIQWLYDDLGVRTFMFFDDNFTVHKERAIEICSGILERGMKIKFVAESHVSHINPEMLAWMKRSGCYRIDFGVESGSPKILKTIKKKQTVNQIETVFQMVHDAGIHPRAYLMVGNPGENEETIQETVDLMGKVKPWDTVGAHPLLIMPNTEIYDLAIRQGLITDDYWLEHDDMLFYTGEHSNADLIRLREMLMKGLAENRGTIKAHLRYLMKKYYYRYPMLQKLRKFRNFLGVKA